MDKSLSTYKRFEGNTRADQDKALEEFQEASDSSCVGSNGISYLEGKELETF